MSDTVAPPSSAATPGEQATTPEPYSDAAWANSEKARAIMEDVRCGEWLGCGIHTVNGGQYVEEISWSIRAKSGAVYVLALTESAMRELGFSGRPTVVAPDTALLCYECAEDECDHGNGELCNSYIERACDCKGSRVNA